MAENKRFSMTVLEAFIHTTLSNTTWHGCIITSTRTQPALEKRNTTWGRTTTMKKELMTMMMSESTALIWMRWKLLFQTMIESAGSSWWLTKAQKSTRQHKKLQRR
jgi:hypothetical protein